MATTKKARANKPASNQTKRTNPAKAAAASGNPAKVRQATARDWIAGARVLTLSLAIIPVAMGAAIPYYFTPEFTLSIALLCLAVAVFLQIGVNYANDYSDGVRGTDAYRIGPRRLTGSGAARPRTVLTVALVFFGLAAAAGIAIVILTGIWWLLAIGAAALVAAWFYTGGKWPYGYVGLGELVAFVFFGLVATVGTTYVQIQMVGPETALAGVIAGLFAAAVLLVNNIRDREHDARAGKKTLAVRMGDLPSRILFVVMIAGVYGALVPFALAFYWAPLVYFTLLISVPTALIVLLAKTPEEHVLALKLTSLAALATGLGLAAAIVFIF